MKAPRSLFPQLSLIATWSLAACSPATDRPAPTATSTPIWTASASPSPSLTPRSSETHIRSPIPTANTTPAPVTRRPAEPVPVVLGREEVKRRTLARFLPEQEAIVVDITYVYGVDFCAFLNSHGGTQLEPGSIPGLLAIASTDYLAISCDEVGAVVAMVAVEAGPPQVLGPDLSYGPNWKTVPGWDGPPEDGRRRITYLYDATSGMSFGSPFLGDNRLPHGEDPGGRRARAFAKLGEHPLRIAVVTAAPSLETPLPGTASGVTTPSPGPTSKVIPGMPGHRCLPPDAVPKRLLPDAVPVQLLETVRWLPYIEGAWWTYETTQNMGRARWSRSNRRVAVAERWRLADDAMLVHFHPTARPSVDTGLAINEPDEWTVLLPGAAFPVDSCKAGAQTLSQQRSVHDRT